MESSNQKDELLVKYLANEVNAREKAMVEEWLEASEENRRHFEGLKQAWQLIAAKQTLDYVLDEMDMDEKWDRFKQNVKAKEQARGISIYEQQFESGYTEEGRPARKSMVYRLFMAAAIAASVLLLIGLGWELFFNNSTEPSVAVNTKGKSDSLSFVVRHEFNKTGKEKKLQLQDGSLIVLANNSEITYREPFTDKRDIILVGKAFFKVAKDKTRPFIVVSGDITTTALGTEFTVTTLKNAGQIIVRLYEGKVVVKAVDKANTKLKKDVYLVPGQAFVYGGQTMAAKVKEFTVNNTAAPEKIISEELSHDNPSLPQNTEGSWYQFNNQSLADVFDNLSQMFNVQINYEKKDVQNIYFTAKYNRTDSLDAILKEISTLHNLTIIKKENAFTISK